MSKRPIVTAISCALVTAAGIAAGCGAPPAERATGDIAQAMEASLAGGTERFDQAAWEALLSSGTKDGLVDYRFMQAHRAELDAYLARVAGSRLGSLTAGHLEALLINAYNACTVRSILEHPGVASIRDIPGVWTEKRHRVGGFDLTLDDIEHRLLRPFFRDPRLHFALNCASRSCAPLPSWAYDGDRIGEELDERTRTFLSSPANVKVEGTRLRVSKYFDWYGEDFTAAGWTKSAPSVAAFIAPYAAPDVKAFIDRQGGRPSLVFGEYDWSLNAAAPLDPSPGRDRPGASSSVQSLISRATSRSSAHVFSIRAAFLGSTSFPDASNASPARMICTVAGRIRTPSAVSTCRSARTARTAPYGPGEAPMRSATFLLNGLPGGREAQSMTFLRVPGIEWLYSGVQMRRASEAAILSLNLRAPSGSPWLASMSPS